MVSKAMLAVQPHDDRRRTPRINVGNLVAHLDFRDGSDMQIVCMWDFSLAGACLIVPHDVQLPDEFDLVIGDLAHPVTKVWRRGSHVGVRLCLASAPLQNRAA